MAIRSWNDPNTLEGGDANDGARKLKNWGLKTTRGGGKNRGTFTNERLVGFRKGGGEKVRQRKKRANQSGHVKKGGGLKGGGGR